MKDARGHGSNKRTSNADAANALASALKSTQAPVHDAMVGQQVQNAYRNAAKYGPEHESVGQSLRNAAGLERDNAVVQRDRFSAKVEGAAAARARDKFGARADAAMRAANSKTGYEMSKRKYPITGRGEHGGVFRTRPRNK